MFLNSYLNDLRRSIHALVLASNFISACRWLRLLKESSKSVCEEYLCEDYPFVPVLVKLYVDVSEVKSGHNFL